MKLTDDLKSLIDSSIIDGSISSNERKVLLKRAISEGHDQDEFELHIDSLLFSKNGSFLKKIIYHRKAGSKQVLKKKGIIEELNEYEQVPVKELKIRIWHLILALIIFLIISIIYFIKPIINTIEEYKLNFQHDCIGVDDCLSKYNFEGARAYISLPYDVGNYKERDAHNDGWVNIIVAESNYWVNNGDFKKALQILDADKQNYNNATDLNFVYFNRAKYDLINNIIEKLLDDNEFDEARKWVLKCPDKHESGQNFREEDGFYKRHKPSEKMRYILNKKIDELEKLSK